MKLNGKNIITDNDVTLTRTHLGETLDVVLDKQQAEIDSLKGNVKWIYQNGGVGGKGGSGGSGSGDNWSIYATLDNTQLKSNNIILNGPGIYKLVVKINKPGGGNFKCDIQYKNENGVQNPPSSYLNIDNVFTTTYNIQLGINDTINVTVTDENGEIKQVNAMYIVNPYDFSIKYTKTNGQEYFSEDNDIFMEDIIENGLGIKINYSIGIKATVQYKYSKFDGTTTDFIPLDFVQGSGESPLLKIAEDLFYSDSSNAGYYTSHVIIEITPENQQPVTIEKQLSCNLIPRNLYLKIKTSSGLIYKDETESNPYQFSPGNVTFYLQPYQGVNLNRKYTLVTEINDVIDSSNSGILNERSNTEYTFLMQKDGWNKIKFTLYSSNGRDSYSVTKYLYIYNSNANLNFDTFAKNSILRVHHLSTNNQSEHCQPIFESNAYLSMNKLNQPKLVNWTINSSQDLSSMLFNIGFELSRTVSEDEPLFILKDIDGITNALDTNFIYIYRNKIKIGQSTSLDIYFPACDVLGGNKLTNYHLLTIHKKYYYTTQGSNTRYFELLVYIDGKLENTVIVNANPTYSTLVFNNSTYNCNFLDILQFNTTQEKDLISDSDVSEYFYTWVSKFNKQDLVPNFNDIVAVHNTVHNKFKLDSGDNNKMVEIDIAALKNLAQVSNSPILLLKVQDIKNFQQGEGVQNFLKWYQKKYNQEESSGSMDVTVLYSQNKSGLQEYSIDGGKFTITVQGSSTKQNFAKNLELGVESTTSDSSETYIYTPNFIKENTPNYTDKDIYNTFLPETSFTLKADKVDSSHCNNNAIGAFVNDNTTKFKTGDNGKYKNYIKNCLTGFACLLFVQTNYRDPVSQEVSTHVYYLGVYNFNLGRKSYYNLGYKSTDNLKSIGLKNGFGIYKINKDLNSKFIDGLNVAEVQDNDPYWDFSQFDKLILSGYNDADKGMYDDFVSNDTSISHTNDIEKLSEFTKRVALAGGYAFTQMGKNFGKQEDKYNASVYDTTHIEADKYKSINQVPDYRQQYTRKVDPILNKIVYTEKERINEATKEDLLHCVAGNIDQGIPSYVDYQSLIEYYVICMAFGMLDSVQKNLNVKSWNNGKTYYIAFYDMDTALGKDNDGKKVGYFAYSDYWTLLTDSTELIDATVQRDFQPKGIVSTLSFFDVPSSYLFAIAKYASIVLDEGSVTTFPLKLWAQFRSDIVDPKLHKGCLKNADYFVDNYFSKRLNDIGPELLNFNYRAKYLAKESNKINYISDINSFQGPGIYKVKDWLNSRLHIIDVYMGLSSTSPSHRLIQRYNKDTSSWESLKISGTEVYETELDSQEIPVNNSDIIIYKDIFSKGEDRKYSSTIDISIRALAQSFLVVAKDASVSRYYLEDPNKTYSIKFDPSGAQNMRLGGSDRWTYISNLSPFYIGSTNIYINSFNLKNFNFDKAILSGSNCIGDQISLPACEEIIFSNAQNCTNDAQINNHNFPIVKTIDLSTSKMGNISIQNVPLEKFYGKDMQSISLSIANSKLQVLDLSNSTFAGEVFLNKVLGNPILNNLQCKKLTIYGNGQDLIINNNYLLEELNAYGFRKIYVTNCPKLKAFNCIDKNQDDYILHDLKIINCGTSYTNPPNQLLNLSQCTSLEWFSMQGTKIFTSLQIGTKDLKVYPSAFENTNLKQCENNYTAKIIITGPNTLKNTPYSSNFVIFKIDDNCTDISGTFSNELDTGGLNLYIAKYFLDNVQNLEQVTNINYLFYGQKNINTTREQLTSNSGIKLGRFKKVKSAVGVLAKTQYDMVNVDMFKDFGDGIVNMDSFFGPDQNIKDETNKYIRVLEHTGFNDLLPRVNSLNMFYIYPMIRIIKIVNQYGNPVQNPNVVELFNNANVNSSNIVSISDFNIFYDSVNNIYPNYTNLFDSPNWSNLRSLFRSFKSVKIDDYKNLKVKKLQLNSISESLVNISTDVLVDMFELLNWEYYLTNCNNQESIGNAFNGTTKYLTKENWDKIWTYISQNRNIPYSISYLFSRTYLIGSDASIPVILNNIRSFYFTFQSIKLIDSMAGVQDINQLTNIDTNYINIDNYPIYFPKAVDWYGAFYNCKILKVPKYNFFNKRKKVITPVYRVTIDGSGIKSNSHTKINLITYTYDKVINSLKQTFENAQFKENTYDYQSFNLSNSKLQTLEGSDLLDTEYYEKVNSTVIKTLSPNEYDYDILHPTTCIYETTNYTNKDNLQWVNTLKTGWDQGEKLGQYILPPDFFAGCTEGCNICNTFKNSNLIGSLPPSLVQGLKAPSDSTGCLCGVNILPTFYGEFTFKHNNPNIKKKRVYSFVPENFFNMGNVNNLIGVVYRIPNNQISDTSNQETVNYYYLLLDTSFKIYPTLYINNNDFYGFINYFNYGEIPINVMFNTKLISNSTCGEDGWSITQIKCDGLFNNSYMEAASGNLFINPASKPINSWIINNYPIITISSSSQGCIFPIATKDLRNIIKYNHNQTISIKNVPTTSRNFYSYGTQNINFN